MEIEIHRQTRFADDSFICGNELVFYHYANAVLMRHNRSVLPAP